MTDNCSLGSGIQLWRAVRPLTGLKRMFRLPCLAVKNGSHGRARNLKVVSNFTMRLARLFQFKNSCEIVLNEYSLLEPLGFGGMINFEVLVVYKFESEHSAIFFVPVGDFRHPIDTSYYVGCTDPICNHEYPPRRTTFQGRQRDQAQNMRTISHESLNFSPMPHIGDHLFAQNPVFSPNYAFPPSLHFSLYKTANHGHRRQKTPHTPKKSKRSANLVFMSY